MANRLVYQVKLGQNKQSKLYNTCIASVAEYCEQHGIAHHVQTSPQLRIAPDPFFSNRSVEATSKHGGFLPIFEKENAFDLVHKYDQIAIVDADIYIRPDSPNIFEDIPSNVAYAAVCENEMPIEKWYEHKITNYSQMQYATLRDVDWKWGPLGGEFFNMGLIVLNCKNFSPYLKGQSAREFMNRYEFKRFIDGLGNWKWSTDQTLLNWWIKKSKMPVHHLDWKWNGLFTANSKINECHFIHFFLKDKLPNGGEDVQELLKMI
jgi:hypothetical protein